MELARGKPLGAYVADRSIAVRDRIGWLTEVARALAGAHDAGLIHRDLKPANVKRDDAPFSFEQPLKAFREQWIEHL